MSTVDQRIRRRAVQRHSAAALRALSAQPTAELRGSQLVVAGRPVDLATPYLAVDLTDAPLGQARGVSDALAALVHHSDLDLHHELRPDIPLERIVFDIAEQLRCESLVPRTFAGARSNIAAAFDAWCRTVRSERVGETGVGLLVYTTVHMIRGRLITRMMDPEVDEIIETTRGNLAALVGHALAALPSSRASQRAYAVPAREISRLIAELAGDAADLEPATGQQERLRLLVPSQWQLDATPEQAGEGDALAGPGHGTFDAEALETLGDYHVFSRAHDRELSGDLLYPEDTRRELRTVLDRQVAAQAVSVPQLARRLRWLLARPLQDGWQFGQEEGLIDAARLSQLVANPANHRIFRDDRLEPTCDAAVTFLIDTSGSMKTQRYESVAVLVDTYCRALHLAGVTTEVLGFTTGAWNGGRPLKEWRCAGAPPDPGRLNQVDHIVYKDAETPWRRARLALASMMRTHHYREGVDGEALIWAYRRLAARTERRKLLVVVSDGVPMDAASTNANRAGFLSDHLAQVASHIERSGTVQLGAIAIDVEVSRFYRNSVAVDLAGTLTLASYRALEDLFGHPPAPGRPLQQRRDAP